MSEWGRVRLSELAADEKSAISKPYGSAFLKEDYVSDGIPVVRGVNLASGVFRDDNFVYISRESASRMPGATLEAGDLVVTHRGTLGQVSMIPRQPRYEKYVASTSHVKVRLDPAKAFSEFYYYWFRSVEGQSSILAHASAVGVPGIAQPVAAVKSLRVPHPPLRTQRAIAEVLGAFDAKIGANVRAIALLVGLADAEFVRHALGVPVGPLTFEDVADIGGGGTPKTSVIAYWDGCIDWATPTDVTGLGAPYLSKTSRTITEDGLDSCSSRLYPAGSILMTSRATIGAFAIARVPLAVNQGFIVVNASDPVNQWWLFHEMRSRKNEFLSHANGATFLELPRGRFKKLPVRVPAPEKARAFASTVEPLHGMAAQLTIENEKLSAMRDELLPLLMSGWTRVRDAGKVVEEVL